MRLIFRDHLPRNRWASRDTFLSFPFRVADAYVTIFILLGAIILYEIMNDPPNIE